MIYMLSAGAAAAKLMIPAWLTEFECDANPDHMSTTSPYLTIMYAAQRSLCPWHAPAQVVPTAN